MLKPEDLAGMESTAVVIACRYPAMPRLSGSIPGACECCHIAIEVSGRAQGFQAADLEAL
jgi:hypothetical protein